jgi:hypothetical protein
MAQDEVIEFFTPPNLLKAKLGGGQFTGVDPVLIRRAEAAIEEIRSEFTAWTTDDVAKLVAARASFAKSRNTRARAALLRAALDMKGQAATFDYPLIARVCASLVRLIGELPREKDLPLSLVDAHVNAVHVICRDKIMDETNAIALALIQELDSQVAVALKN